MDAYSTSCKIQERMNEKLFRPLNEIHMVLAVISTLFLLLIVSFSFHLKSLNVNLWVPISVCVVHSLSNRILFTLNENHLSFRICYWLRSKGDNQSCICLFNLFLYCVLVKELNQLFPKLRILWCWIISATLYLRTLHSSSGVGLDTWVCFWWPVQDNLDKLEPIKVRKSSLKTDETPVSKTKSRASVTLDPTSDPVMMIFVTEMSTTRSSELLVLTIPSSSPGHLLNDAPGRSGRTIIRHDCFNQSVCSFTQNLQLHRTILFLFQAILLSQARQDSQCF